LKILFFFNLKLYYQVSDPEADILDPLPKPGRLKLLATSLIQDSEAETEKSEKFRQVLDKLDELMKTTKDKSDIS